MLAPVTRQRKGATKAVAAPIGGLNARDALAAMPPTDASVLTNLFPYADRVETRAGYSTLATATSAPPAAGDAFEGFRALMERDGTIYGAWKWTERVAGVNYARLRIYSIASGGALTNVREVVTTGGANSLVTIGEWQKFASASGSKYLLLPTVQTIGGVSTYVLTAFDGTSWTTPTVTGVDPLNCGLAVHRNRLWFYGSFWGTPPAKPLSAYYLPVGAISGTVAEFNVGPFASKGGTICAIRTWTIDGGDGGTDDLCAFFTTAGQLILYSGTDPSSLATWALVGVFDLADAASYLGSYLAPGNAEVFIKDAFAVKYGADLLMLTTGGIAAASNVLRPSATPGEYTISQKIRPLITTAAMAASTSALLTNALTQWKLVYHPTLKQLLLVIPTASSSSQSGTVITSIISAATIFAMNAETGAWCQFDGMNMLDAIPVGNALYFIDGSSKIYKYGAAASDNGSAITFEARQAYNYLDSPENKLATMVQPQARVTGNFSVTLQVDADFNAGTISAYKSYTVPVAANAQPWISVNKYGRALAIHLKGQTSVGVFSWYATTWLYKPAGPI